MGNQIALQCASRANQVTLHDSSPAALEQSGGRVAEFLDRMIEDGCAPADQRASILERIRRTSELADAVRDAELVIEAVQEDLAVKRDVFRQLDELAPPAAILTTNSSSLRISRIESATNRPTQVFNTHFV